MYGSQVMLKIVNLTVTLYARFGSCRKMDIKYRYCNSTHLIKWLKLINYNLLISCQVRLKSLKEMLLMEINCLHDTMTQLTSLTSCSAISWHQQKYKSLVNLHLIFMQKMVSNTTKGVKFCK
jgi:hypothetical protein